MDDMTFNNISTCTMSYTERPMKIAMYFEITMS